MTLIEAPVIVATPQTLLYSLTWPEVLTAKKPVSDARGYLVGGPDRRGANAVNPVTLWRTWQREVQERLESVPPAVADYFLKSKHLTSPPKVGSNLEVIEIMCNPKEEILNLDLGLDSAPAGALGASAPKKLSNPPRFATSFSGMEAFLNCPYAWAASKYFKTVAFEETEAIKWGNRVHATAENYLKGAYGKVEAECLPLVKRYCDLFLGSGATLHIEKEMCFTKEMKTCGWKDWNTVWFRGKADVISIKDRKLNVYDWKTGKLKTDTFQLEVMIALADLYYGDQFDEANGKLIFVKEADPKKALVGLDKPVLKADIPKIWERIFAITSRMEAAWEHENFRKQTSGLCRQYCGAMDCVHNGRR